jgi:hypothetical protein
MELLPLRVEKGLERVLGIQQSDLAVVAGPENLPRLRGELPRPIVADVSIVFRVHARTGVPLAYSRVNLSRGDRAFETPSMTLMAMEGYAHLAPAERLLVEGRVWSRRAYATASAA